MGESWEAIQRALVDQFKRLGVIRGNSRIPGVVVNRFVRRIG
jgi:hypothetical protein